VKNIFKKNQIMITALAIMIAVAGYLNFAGEQLSEEELQAVSGEAVATEMDEMIVDEVTIDESAMGEYGFAMEEYGDGTYEISDEDMAYAEIESLDEDISMASGENDMAASTEGEAASAQDAVTVEDAPGEAVFTSGTSVTALSDAKLIKEQTRAKNKETLLEIINSTAITEQQKQGAVENMIRLTDIAEKETAAEILLEAKGFEDVVVSISDSGVDVVVNATTLSDAQCAQIEDIVTRKTSVAPENIIIQCSK